MNFAQKLKKVADATKGMKGLFQADIIHKEGCPARSTGNIISCNCDFEVTVKRKNSDKTESGKDGKTVKKGHRVPCIKELK